MLTKIDLILHGDDWVATILPSCGANVVRLLHQGTAILRSPSHVEQIAEQPYLFGMPILFPANRTADGTFVFEGREYRLPLNEPERQNHLHGLLWNAPFQTTEAGYNFVRLEIENHGEYYPFPFDMSISYHLEGGAFIQRTVIHNTGFTAMPALLAFHTTFCAADTFHVPIRNRWERDPLRLLPTNRLLDLNEAEKKIAAGTAPCTRPVVGYFTSAGNRSRIGNYYYEVSPLFTQWVIYNGDGKQGFVCIEPQTNPVNGLTTPGSHLIIASGKTLSFETQIYPV